MLFSLDIFLYRKIWITTLAVLMMSLGPDYRLGGGGGGGEADKESGLHKTRWAQS